MKLTRKKFAIHLLMLPLLGNFGCDGDSEGMQSKGAQALIVDVVVVEPQHVLNQLDIPGTLLPNEQANLTTQIGGRVAVINFEEGEQVEKGRALLQIDDREMRAQAAQLKAQLDLAKSQLERQQKMFEVEGISQNVLDEALANVESLKAQYAQAQAGVGYASVPAPFSGKIGLRKVSPGDYISPGTEIASLVQDDPMKVEFNVPEEYATQIREKQKLNFRIEGSDSVYVAEVYAFEPRIDPGTRSLKVRAKARNPEGKLFAGSFVSIALTLDSLSDAIMVPTDAIVPKLNSLMVYRVKNGKAEEVEVKTGVRQSSFIQIVSGLDAGDSVMVTGLLQVRDGMPVNVANIENVSPTEGGVQ